MPLEGNAVGGRRVGEWWHARSTAGRACKVVGAVRPTGSSAILTSVPGGVKRREIERNEPRLGDLAVGHSVHAGGAPRNAPATDCRLAVGELDEHVLPLDRSPLAYRERSGRQRPPVQEVREHSFLAAVVSGDRAGSGNVPDDVFVEQLGSRGRVPAGVHRALALQELFDHCASAHNAESYALPLVPLTIRLARP